MELGIIIFIRFARANCATCMLHIATAAQKVLCLTMWRLHFCSYIINGDSISVLLHVSVCKTGYNISGIIGTKLWE